MCYIDEKKPAAMEKRAGEEGNCGVVILISYIFGVEDPCSDRMEPPLNRFYLVA